MVAAAFALVYEVNKTCSIRVLVLLIVKLAPATTVPKDKLYGSVIEATPVKVVVPPADIEPVALVVCTHVNVLEKVELAVLKKLVLVKEAAPVKVLARLWDALKLRLPVVAARDVTVKVPLAAIEST